MNSTKNFCKNLFIFNAINLSKSEFTLLFFNTFYVILLFLSLLAFSFRPPRHESTLKVYPLSSDILIDPQLSVHHNGASFCSSVAPVKSGLKI